MDRRRVLTAALAAAALVLVVLAVTLLGRWQFTDRFHLPIDFGPGSGALATPELGTPSQASRPPLTGTTRDLRWIGWVLRVLVGLVIAAAVVYVIGLLRARRRPPAAAPVPDDTPVLHEVVRDAVRTARTYLLRHADTGEVAQAVVEAWVALETVAAESGLPRGAQQTPTEFTASLLRSVSTADAEIAELLGLYHRARYGSDEVVAELGRVHAERAAHLLGVVAEQIEVRPARSGAGARTGRHE